VVGGSSFQGIVDRCWWYWCRCLIVWIDGYNATWVSASNGMAEGRQEVCRWCNAIRCRVKVLAPRETCVTACPQPHLAPWTVLKLRTFRND
jgi:hypothetical protein